MSFQSNHLCSIDELSDDDVRILLEQTHQFFEVNQRSRKKVPALRGVSVVLFFCEPSTRTKLSFELAAKRLSADTLSLNKNVSSLQKGESFTDTCRTLKAMSPDVVILRHSSSGAPFRMRELLPESAIINAGDGTHEHPTQALLDAFTLVRAMGERNNINEALKNKHIALVGDIAHSRVAGSNLRLLPRLGARVSVAGPGAMIPKGIDAFDVEHVQSVDDIIGDVDAVMMLRIQKERLSGASIPSDREYAKLFGLTKERASRMKKNALILHPGPINRGVEIESLVAESARSRILDQVESGIALRMSALFHLAAANARKQKSKEHSHAL